MNKTKLEQQQAEIDKLTQERDRFRAAINDECLNWQFTVDEENPRESMRQLLEASAMVAREPSVCEEAANFALEQQLKGVQKCKIASQEWIIQHEGWLKEQLKNGGEL